MAILINRFEASVEPKGLKITIEGKSIITIKDHSTDKIIGMINLTDDVEKNMQLAGEIITTIEGYIENETEH